MRPFDSILEAEKSIWVAFGNIFRMALFLSPLHTIKTILENGHTVPYSAFTYIVSFLNCVVWTVYGLSSDPNNKDLVRYINAVGAALHLMYFLIHYVHCPVKEKRRVFKMKLVSLIILGLIIAFAIYLVPEDQRTTTVGWICGILNILMYAAPLSVLEQVITTQSVTSLPFLQSFLTLINSALWLLYSVVNKDAPLSMVLNGIGATFGVIQLILHAVYPDDPSRTAEDDEPEARMEHMTA